MAAAGEESGDFTSAHPHGPLISTFCEITSASAAEAQFFLESHNFDLDSAVSTFLETATATAGPDLDNRNDNEGSLPQRNNNEDGDDEEDDDDDEEYNPSRSRSPSPAVAYSLRSKKPSSSSAASGGGGKRTGAGRGGIRTLADLNRRQKDESDGSDSDEPQEYYTGGEKSGMLVRDPSRAHDVEALFNQARQAGAMEGPAEHLPSSSSRSFTGTGRLLSGERVTSAPQQPEVVTHNITFWRNGFTVDDGPLRRFDDPENALFLESIGKSECPKELEPADRSTVVHVNLTRKEENCPVQEKRCVPFKGVGRTLGSTSSTTEEVPTVASTSLTTCPAPSMGLIVDQALPSTSIQLRLADGTRMVARFNYHHSIRDIRGFIDASRPGGAMTYQLQTVGFPPKQLTDLDQTIEQAGLANSVVIQKVYA